MNIYEAIASIMSKGYAVSKDSKNQTQGFMYRGIDAVMNTFQPLMAEAGIFVVPEVLEETREERVNSRGTTLIYAILKIKYTFYASDGSNVSAVVIGEGMDTGDKASNKAMSVAMKYAMFQVFCIPTEEMIDPDEESHEVEPKKEQKKAEPKPVPQPDAQPATQVPKYICEDCKAEITPFRDPTTGKGFSVEAVVNNSKKKYGKTLCSNCQAKAKVAQA